LLLQPTCPRGDAKVDVCYRSVGHFCPPSIHLAGQLRELRFRFTFRDFKASVRKLLVVATAHHFSRDQRASRDNTHPISYCYLLLGLLAVLLLAALGEHAW
jgi:hypothetical protein